MKLFITILILTGIAAANCGTERWPVKTLSDQDKDLVDMLNITDTTIATLIRSTPLMKSNLLKAKNRRIDWQEKKQFRIRALIRGAKLELDGDFHIVISDPDEPNTTMIVEIPSPDCMSANYKLLMAGLRLDFENRFGKVTSKYKVFDPPVLAILTGIGFNDFIHGQTGVARNGFELHPLTKIEFLTPIDCEGEKEKCQ